MRILFDQNMPRQLRSQLRSHVVMTAAQMGWDRLENGDLLRVAEDAGFELMLTGDQNLIYQHNNRNRKIALVVLSNTQKPSVMAQAQSVVAAVNAVTQGSFTMVKIEHTARKRRGAAV